MITMIYIKENKVTTSFEYKETRYLQSKIRIKNIGERDELNHCV